MRLWASASLTALAVLAFAPASEAAIVGMFANGELTVEDLDGEANALTVSLDGDSYVIRDSKQNLEINGGSLFNCAFPDEPDRHRVSCTRPRGSEPKLQTLNAGGGADEVTVDEGIDIQDMFGGGGNDDLSGGAKDDRINGDAGNDTVTGGGGSDRLYGAAGDDTIRARDGVSDGLITCGAGKDVAFIDKNDPNPIDCEKVDRGEAPTPPQELSPTGVRVKVPDVRPRKRGGRYMFKALAQLEEALQKAGVPYRIKTKRVGFGEIHKSLRRHVENGEITKQDKHPAPNSTVVVDPACKKGQGVPCRLTIKVAYYDESIDYEEFNGENCPTKPDSNQTAFFLRLFEDAAYSDALAMLKRFNCDYRVLRWIEIKGIRDMRVRGAALARNRTGEGRRFYIGLVVERPRRSDFTMGITGRPRSDYEQTPERKDDFDKEIDLGSDGKLTAGRTRGVVTVNVNENWTGRFVRKLKLRAVREDGVVLASSETTRTGAVTFTLPLDWTGDLDIHAVVSLDGGDEMAGWVTIPVVDRKGAAFYTESGRYFTFQNGRYVLTQRPQVAALAPQAQALAKLAPRFGDAGADCRQVLRSTALPQDKLRHCWEQDGIQLTQFSSGGTTGGSLEPARIVNLPGFTVVNGRIDSSRLASVEIPGRGSVLGASIVGSNSGGIVPSPQALIGQDGGSLIGQDGGSIVSDYTGGLTPPATGAVTRLKGQLLIGQDGGSLIGQDGGSLIGQDGGSFISENGGAALPVVPRG